MAVNSQTWNCPAHKRYRCAAGDFRRVEKKKFVYKIGCKRCTVQWGACFKQDAENLAPAQFFQRGLQVELLTLGRQTNQFHSRVFELARFWRIQRSRREYKQIIILRSYDSRLRRKAQFCIEY